MMCAQAAEIADLKAALVHLSAHANGNKNGLRAAPHLSYAAVFSSEAGVPRELPDFPAITTQRQTRAEERDARDNAVLLQSRNLKATEGTCDTNLSTEAKAALAQSGWVKAGTNGPCVTVQIERQLE